MRMAYVLLVTLASAQASAFVGSNDVLTAARATSSLQQAALELDKLNAEGIHSYEQLAGARHAQVATIVGDVRASELREAASWVVHPSSIVAPGSRINAKFLFEPRFVVNPVLRSDSTTQQRLLSARRRLVPLNAVGITRFRHLYDPRRRGMLERQVGAVYAQSLADAAKMAAARGLINPHWLIDASFLIDSRVFVNRGL